MAVWRSLTTLELHTIVDRSALRRAIQSLPVLALGSRRPRINDASMHSTPIGVYPAATVADYHDQIEYTQDILDKRYFLYSWCETKNATLAAVNSFLLGAQFVAINALFENKAVFNLPLMVAAGLLYATATIIVLWHVEPLMRSGRLKGQRNVRSVMGVEQYGSKEEYFRAIQLLDLPSMLRHNTDQIYGMNRNIMKNQSALRIAATMTILGIVLFATAIITAKGVISK